MIGNSESSSAVLTLLCKAASDNGFDIALARNGNWLCFDSTMAPLRIWLSSFHDAVLLAGFSNATVAQALDEYGIPVAGELPTGCAAARSVKSFDELHRLVRRAFQLSRSLPDEPLRLFREQTAFMPRSTEAERLVIQRVGQDLFRERLMEYWEGRCAISGLAVPKLLRASHIKPWADCEADEERLDVFNGFLLAPHLDAAFDAGLITVADDCTVVVSDSLDSESRRLLSFDRPLRVRSLDPRHKPYLAWHRLKVRK